MFDTLLLQKGLNYFDDSRSSTNFDKPEALEAFREWTDFYTKYGLPQDFDFYNRFRTGEMPIGIPAGIHPVQPAVRRCAGA